MNNKSVGTPEQFFSIPDHSDKSDISDAINCTITRADAVVALLYSQFESKDISRLTDHMMQNALWTLTGYLDQLRILTKNN
jgi:hypothetical protein